MVLLKALGLCSVFADVVGDFGVLGIGQGGEVGDGGGVATHGEVGADLGDDPGVHAVEAFADSANFHDAPLRGGESQDGGILRL